MTQPEILARFEDRGWRALRELAESAPSAAQVRVFFLPQGNREVWDSPELEAVRAAGVPIFHFPLGAVAPGATEEETLNLHPPAAVYRWYATELADALVDPYCQRAAEGSKRFCLDGFGEE